MFRQIYLAVMGGAIGGVMAAAACGHPALWLGVGVALGVGWGLRYPADEEALEKEVCSFLKKRTKRLLFRRRTSLPAMAGWFPLAQE